MSGPVLRVEELTVEFPAPGGPLRAADAVSFELAEGEVLGLVGESGSGKTVTCRALMRLLPGRRARIAGGAVWLGARDLLTLPESAMQRVRGEEIGMIFQNPMLASRPADGDRRSRSARRCAFTTGSAGARRPAARSSCCSRSASPIPRCAPGPTRTSCRAACGSAR